MSDQKITELTEIDSLSSDDVLPVVDVSANQTKKTPWQTFLTAISDAILAVTDQVLLTTSSVLFIALQVRSSVQILNGSGGNSIDIRTSGDIGLGSPEDFGTPGFVLKSQGENSPAVWASMFDQSLNQVDAPHFSFLYLDTPYNPFDQSLNQSDPVNFSSLNGTGFQAFLINGNGGGAGQFFRSHGSGDYQAWEDYGLDEILDEASITPVADGTYTVGKGLVTDGLITVSKGIITAIQEAT